MRNFFVKRALKRAESEHLLKREKKGKFETQRLRRNKTAAQDPGKQK